MIKISAIICTFKRPDYLRHALRSLCEQSLTRQDYEIIVVDNAGEAETQQVVKDFDDGSVNLRYMIEKEVGLNRARNAGLKAAAGRYVAYIDDDARAETQWLEALVGAFEQVSPEPAAVGGRVWLDWHGERPSWVPERHLALYTYVDHGNGAHSLRDDEYLVGANLAFEKNALSLLGGFDPELDRQGTVLLSGGDTAAIEQLRQNGRAVTYEPAAVVWHSVLQSRKRPSWLLRRLFWDGASQPFLERPNLARPADWRAALIDVRQCGRWGLDMFVALVRCRRQDIWESLLGLSQRTGRLRTHLQLMTARK
jgi:glycosyltransferase involved in cell wall biosynthesis